MYFKPEPFCALAECQKLTLREVPHGSSQASSNSTRLRVTGLIRGILILIRALLNWRCTTAKQAVSGPAAGGKMSKASFGRLIRRDDLREFWDREASDFTPWLAEAENLEQLAEALHLD